MTQLNLSPLGPKTRLSTVPNDTKLSVALFKAEKASLERKASDQQAFWRGLCW